MNRLTAWVVLAAVGFTGTQARALPTISIVDDTINRWVDVFYTPSAPPAEFTVMELVVTPTLGGLLDPIPSKRFDNVQDGADPDTWTNTDFSSVGAGAGSRIFNSYHPGQPFPPIAQDPLPTAGGEPDRLDWTTFETNVCDSCGLTPFHPFHMARVLYTAGGVGTVEVRFYETVGNPTYDIPFVFTGTYGVPEPATLILAAFGLFCIRTPRRR